MKQLLIVNVTDEKKGVPKEDGIWEIAYNLQGCILQNPPVLTMNQVQRVGQLRTKLKAEYRGGRGLFYDDKIFRKDISTALILHKYGDPHVPGHLENFIETLFDIGPDVVPDDLLIHIVLELLYCFFSGENAVEIPVAVFIDQSHYLALHGA